jgi:hypothetical protein
LVSREVIDINELGIISFVLRYSLQVNLNQLPIGIEGKTDNSYPELFLNRCI